MIKYILGCFTTPRLELTIMQEFTFAIVVTAAIYLVIIFIDWLIKRG